MKKLSRVFLNGDWHKFKSIETSYINMKNFPEQKELTKDDILIQLGDFGMLWYYPKSEQQYKKDKNALNYHGSKKYTLFVVPGNHENYDLINALPIVEFKGAKAYKLDTKDGFIYFAIRGEIYTINGKTFLTIGGAQSGDYNSRIRLSDVENNKLVKIRSDRMDDSYGKYKIKKSKMGHINHWDDELLSEDDKENVWKNLLLHSFKVDFVLTHTAPEHIIAKAFKKYDLGQEEEIDNFGNTYVQHKLNDEVSNFLSKVYRKIEFKEWHFAHIHVDSFFEDENGIFKSHYKSVPLEINFK